MRREYSWNITWGAWVRDTCTDLVMHRHPDMLEIYSWGWGGTSLNRCGGRREEKCERAHTLPHLCCCFWIISQMQRLISCTKYGFHFSTLQCESESSCCQLKAHLHTPGEKNAQFPLSGHQNKITHKRLNSSPAVRGSIRTRAGS